MTEAPSQKRVEPKRLKGFRDYLPEAMATRLAITDVLRREAALAGFKVIGTPALEYAQTLLGQGGDETDKQVYRFKDHGDRDVALRFDLTVPFARFVAEHQGELVFPFKKLQMGDVWRGENTQKGRYREFCQCDLDIIGVDSAAADIEILSVFQRVLAEIDGGAFTQGVGNRVILSALIKKILAVPDAASEQKALIALDKLAKIGTDAVVDLLGKDLGAGEAASRALLAVLTAKGEGGGTDLARVAAELASDDRATREIQRVKLVVDTVRQATALIQDPKSSGKIHVDLTLARGLAYYTGIVFETTLDALPGFGSVSSGGRYNDLASRFTARELPGVGGSIGLDRLLAGLEELGRLGAGAGRTVLVAVATDDALAYAAELAARLRGAGIAAELGLVGKLGNQFKYADRQGCPFVVTVGTTEMTDRTYALKDMRSGAETKGLPAADIAAKLAAALP